MSLLRFKTTVKPEGIRPELLLAIIMVHSIYDKYGYDCIITSLNDSVHSQNSKHFSGDGVDFRTKHITDSQTKIEILREIMLNLTFNGYDVLFESEGKDNEHLHVEYDPKKKGINV